MPVETVVVGCGVFGITAARELHRRGHRVTVLDAGPVPHPLAASTDISKVIRMEYGHDEGYMVLAERAREGWLAWNERWRLEGRPPLYHEAGVLMLCRRPMAPGGFEFESFRLLERRGHQPTRMTKATVGERFPAWRSAGYVDGFFHHKGGYAESGRVVKALQQWAGEEGITIRAHTRVASLYMQGDRISGVRTDKGDVIPADAVVVAAGAWTGALVGLEDDLRVTGHPVFHLRPSEPALFEASRFPTFTADIAETGYYGFPLHAEGVVKIANHGPGRVLRPDDSRDVTSAEHQYLRRFLRETFPDLGGADMVASRVCLYADTRGGDFWIDGDPTRLGLIVASGGSGHAFKFAPVLGELVADAVEGVANPLLRRFRWRPGGTAGGRREAARHWGES